MNREEIEYCEQKEQEYWERRYRKDQSLNEIERGEDARCKRDERVARKDRAG